MQRWIVCLAIVCFPHGSPAQQSIRDADVSAFREGLIEYDASFSPSERARALRMLDDLAARAGELSEAEFQLALAEIAALAENAHTQLLPTQWAIRFPRLAVRFFPADNGLFIADATPEHEGLLGSRIEAIEGVPLDSLRSIWARYAPGTGSFRDQTLPYFLESPAILAAAGVAGDTSAVRLQLGDGRVVRVGTSDAWPQPEGVWAFLPAPRALEIARAGRVSGDPLYLQDPDRFFRLVPLPEHNAVYLQFRANIDFSGATDLAAEATVALETLRSLSPRNVIVDQRFNIGGDLNTTRTLMQALPGITGERGSVYAIVSGRTFSAGIASLGYLRQAAGPALTIVGQPLGDHLEFWAEGEPLELPSGTVFLRATERHNYQTGCPESDCHGSIRRHPIRVPTLAPEFRPVFTYEDLVEGRDPYLEAVLQLMGAGPLD